MYNVDTVQSPFFFYFPHGITKCTHWQDKTTQTWLHKRNHKRAEEPFDDNALHTLACTYEYNHPTNTCIHAFFSFFMDKDAQVWSRILLSAIILLIPISNWEQTSLLLHVLFEIINSLKEWVGQLSTFLQWQFQTIIISLLSAICLMIFSTFYVFATRTPCFILWPGSKSD